MSDLVNPDSLTRHQIQLLRSVDRFRFVLCRNGFRQPGSGQFVQRRSVHKLEELGLVRNTLYRGRYTLELTGNGKTTLALESQRRNRAAT